ncbi:hypothetical protein OUZ56_030158 [Daphnia magna]|uniref:Uncharacterized protein n=1 Tax=Daphnia magna TaxID=35525 RepID=A0ABQ9ZQH1_9CRUS|nr:hypothetical protein OUZ56_030158 [Daphnia magna]
MGGGASKIHKGGAGVTLTKRSSTNKRQPNWPNQRKAFLLLFFLIPAIHVWLNGDALHRHDGEKREKEREAIVTHTHGNELRVYNTAVDLLPGMRNAKECALYTDPPLA